ncbi:hypothetical protein Taro_010857 [Colocasia esculenta]|uniref:Uncharacterized protein n=1 Tax=Colocasia esculenta TaxID=4460 RepID=A0A843UAU8_COLES|nr:hypothetical protein [Colocasia esculenta]
MGRQFDSEIIQRNPHLTDYEVEKEREKSLALWLRKRIWCVEHDRAPVLGGAAMRGVCSRHQVWVSLHLLILEYQVRVSLHLLILEYQVWCKRISLQEGGGSFYDSTLREFTNSYLYKAIIDSRVVRTRRGLD